LKLLKSILDNGWMELAARWLLGFSFIYASYHKIIDPAEFAKIVYGYDLFPAILINLIAIIIPYVELFTGVFLVLGIYPRSAALIAGMMFFVFIIVLSINLARGHEFDCGCFSFSTQGKEPSTKEVLFRDFLYLLVTIHVLMYKKPRKGGLRSPFPSPSTV
jgi:uncharacterized membrane protein YphA (DoxX/SURF4 family)